MSELILAYLTTLGWGVVGIIIMAIALPIVIYIFSKFTPIDEWTEIKKGNIGIAIIIAALIIAFAVVIGFAIIPAS